MNRVLVAGLGNELRGDDAAGLLAARALSRLSPAGTDVEEHAGDAAMLAESMSRHEVVIVIDAVADGAPAGTVHELDPERAAAGRQATTHGLGLGEAIALARALGGRPAVRVVGISGRIFELGAEASSAVVRSAGRVAAALAESPASRFE